MTDLVEKGHIKQFRGKENLQNEDSQSQNTSEATISVQRELWNSEGESGYESQNSFRSLLINRNLKNMQNENYVYDRDFL